MHTCALMNGARSEPKMGRKSAKDPYREVVRKKMNRKLKRHGEVIDLDSLFGKYDPALWRDGAWSQFIYV